uniref:G_PROTEIN_RECEP_F1_2 domain-containing protein n=1 Tax=Caenorhabditis tropicalis TaxID=1561998 RepID=A0A1I7TN16_9PELO
MKHSVLIWPTDDDALGTIIHTVYFFIVFIGLGLNIYVVCRMKKFYKSDKDQFLNGTGLYLLSMALCDAINLVLSSFEMLTYLLPIAANEETAHVLCKIVEFVLRCCYTYSMYCWLFMSGLRYFAVFQAIHYTTVWRSPWHMVIPCFIVAIITNLYLLVAVKEDNFQCAVVIDDYSSLYSSVDVFISTLVPVSFVLALDLLVLCFRPTRQQTDPLLQVVFHKLDEDTEKRRQQTTRKFMFVTLLAIGMSAPDGILRAIRFYFDGNVVFVLFQIFKGLYLARFTFNAFYLTLFVFDRNLLSKVSSSRHLSVSMRRLEEEPAIVPRERSRTLSCQRPPLVTSLTRNASCIIYKDDKDDRDNNETSSTLWV